MAYFTLLVDYGFNLSATRKISVKREDLVSINHITSNVLAAKALLCVIGFCVLFSLIRVVPKLHENSSLLLILYGTVIGNVLFPTWLFQGMEKMAFISLINLIMRAVVVAGIFLLVQHPDDYLVYAGILSLGSIAAGLAAAGVAFYVFKLRPVMPSLRKMWEALVEGWTLFLSMASVSLYTAGNAFILGLLTNPTVVGYYSAAEKIVRGVLSLLGPVSQAAYPKFSKMASESKDLALQWARRMLTLVGMIGSSLSVIMFITAPLIVKTVLGPGYEPSIIVVQTLSWLCLLVGASNVLGIQIMLPFGKDRAFTLILFVAGVSNLTLSLLFVPMWQLLGMAISVLISEAFVTIAMFLFLLACNLNPLLNVSLEGKRGSKR